MHIIRLGIAYDTHSPSYGTFDHIPLVPIISGGNIPHNSTSSKIETENFEIFYLKS